MPSAAVTRLRVAQAARVPVSAAQIVEYLRADEEAHNLSAEKVDQALAEWVDAGLLEELPGAEPRYVHAAVFAHDLQRRVVAHLARPRNVESLTAELRQDVTIGPISEEAVRELLAPVVRAGLVVSVGAHDDPAAIVAAVQSDERAITMPKERADGLVARWSEKPTAAWETAGEQFVMSGRAFDALQVT